jgi:hypothetical protein
MAQQKRFTKEFKDEAVWRALAARSARSECFMSMAQACRRTLPRRENFSEPPPIGPSDRSVLDSMLVDGDHKTTGSQ